MQILSLHKRRLCKKKYFDFHALLLLLRNIFSFGSFLFFFTGSLFAADVPAGSQSFYWGRAGTAAHALGYSGISELSGLGGGAYNPAALANIKRIVSGLTVGGFGTPELLGDLQMAFPSDYGVFGFDVFLSRYSARYASEGVNPIGGFVFRWAKPLSRNMFWGADFNFHYISTNQKKDFGLSINSGIVYQKFTGTKPYGFLDPAIGFVIRGVGKPALFDKVAVVNPPGIGIGMAASFVSIKPYRLRMISDINIGFVPMNFGWSIGLEQKFYDIVKLNVGYNLTTSKVGIPKAGPFHLGLGFLIKIPNKKNRSKHEYAPSDVDLELFYTLSRNYYAGKPQWTHFLRLDIAWGYYDDKPPQGNILAEHNYFSPNYDGIKDELILKLQAHDNIRVNRWKVELFDEHKTLVREWKSLDPLEVKKLNFKKFFSQIARKKVEAEVPKQIHWDGQNIRGRRVGDGTYSYHLKIWDDNDNVFTSEMQTVVLDTIVPRFEAFSGYNIFSPNGDKAKDILEISFEARNYSADDTTDIAILNEDKKVVRSFHYQGIPPNIISWDGKTSQGKIAAQGIYSIFIESRDKASNGTSQLIENIRLVTDYETVTLTTKNNFLSPNDDGYFDNIEIATNVSSGSGLESWEISISKNVSLNNKKLIRTFKGYDSLPQKIIWDGKDNEGKIFPDGFYTVQAQLYYDSGNFPTSKKINLEIDTVAPEIEIKKPPYLAFSPNEDSRQDEINFTYQINGQADDTIEMRVQDSQENTFVKKIFSLEHLPSMFTWNGIDENKNLAKQGNYSYKILAHDKARNFSQKQIDGIFLKRGTEDVSLESSLTAFAPNGDGYKDEIKFFPKLSSSDNLTSMSLIIRDRNQNIVKTFVSQKSMPQFIWKGTNEKNKSLPNGDYFCQIQTQYNFGDAPLSNVLAVSLDTQAPKISFRNSEHPFFSPNEDNKKDSLVIEQEVLAQADDSFQGKIQNEKGKVVKEYFWEHTFPPRYLLWNGNDQNNKPVKEGKYRYILQGEDSLKNKSSAVLDNIVLVRKKETADISLSYVHKKNSSRSKPSQTNQTTGGFSSVFSSLNISTKTSSSRYLKNSELIIKDNQSNEVFHVFLQNSSQKFSKNSSQKYINNSLVQQTQWNGFENNDTNKALMRDGLYTVFSRYEYWHGNVIESSHKQFVLDSHAPQISLTTAPAVFTPDNDGENDKLFISFVLDDFSGIQNWRASVKQNGKTIKTFTEKSTEANFDKNDSKKILIVWNGEASEKESKIANKEASEEESKNFAQQKFLITSLQKYNVEIEASDKYENKNVVQQNIHSGVLLEQATNGLHIYLVLNSEAKKSFVQTKNDFDKIIHSLRRLFAQPNRYNLKENFIVELYVHHDDSQDSIQAEKLSRQIYNYLLLNDLDEKQIVVQQNSFGNSLKEKTARVKALQKNKNYVVEFFIEK